MNSPFDYRAAFGRNLGLVNEAEQACLRRLRVALPGLGGVGGAHLHALARLGVGAFHLADLDRFEVVNINRQFGASMDTVGRPKTEVLAEHARSINPEARVQVFPQGITERNLGAFLEGVDVVLDGLEFFCFEIRRSLYRACRERGIPVICAGPIGYGCSLLVFQPAGISFEAYYGIEEDMTRAEMQLAFGLGLAPGLAGDVDPQRVDIAAEHGPALASACFLCAAAAATEVLKLATGRGRVAAAPRGVHFDLFRGRTVPLRPRPSLRRSLRGRILRWFAFRRFPEVKVLHERELALRKSGLQCQVPALTELGG